MDLRQLQMLWRLKSAEYAAEWNVQRRADGTMTLIMRGLHDYEAAILIAELLLPDSLSVEPKRT